MLLDILYHKKRRKTLEEQLPAYVENDQSLFHRKPLLEALDHLIKSKTN